MKTETLDADEVLISFDVISLYTKKEFIKEAIQEGTEKLYSGDVKAPSVDKESFIILATLSCTNVLKQTHDGNFKQIDGLAMGSPPAPPLSNIWLSKYEPNVRDDAKLLERCMDDIVRKIKVDLIENKLVEINSLHPKLKFTLEVERNKKLSFLDMCIEQNNINLFIPKRYKRSFAQGFIF